jgi:uncharacterized repeat protein (TIGR03803 family)
MKGIVGLATELALAGIGILALATLMPHATFAAPAIALKASFDGTNGRYPYAALTPDGHGKFFGTTRGNSSDSFGTIFEFDPSGSGSITLKASFDGSSGAYPFAALTQADSGKFYGTADYGGANCDL